MSLAAKPNQEILPLLPGMLITSRHHVFCVAWGIGWVSETPFFGWSYCRIKFSRGRISRSRIRPKRAWRRFQTTRYLAEHAPYMPVWRISI